MNLSTLSEVVLHICRCADIIIQATSDHNITRNSNNYQGANDVDEEGDYDYYDDGSATSSLSAKTEDVICDNLHRRALLIQEIVELSRLGNEIRTSSLIN